MTDRPYQTQLYYMFTLEPLHIGSKEMALGRVDNTIVRDAGTGLPKIPATGLSGAVRSYTAMHYPKKFMFPVNLDGQVVYGSCAGRGTDYVEGTCGEKDCPVCMTYGFSNPDDRAFNSMVQFQDSNILFYPVSTMIGPVWITSLGNLRTFVESDFLPKNGIDLKITENSYEIQTEIGSGKLNMGWVLLDVAARTSPLTEAGKAVFRSAGISDEVLNRVVAVPSALLGQLVNNNLEVRTSNAIDHITGTVIQGALFSYEAIPRGTVLWTQITYKNPSNFLLDKKPVDKGLDWVKQQVELGLSYLDPMGVGGMTSRGMGRMKVLNLEVGK